MRVGALLGDLRNLAADFQVTVWIVGINNGHGYAGIAAHIAVLLPALGGIEDDVIPVDVDPYGSGLRAAVGHQGGQAGKGFFVE